MAGVAPSFGRNWPVPRHAPAAVRVIADASGAGGEHRFPHRFGVFGGHEHHPLVQVRSDGQRRENFFDGQSQRFGERIGHSGGRCVGVRVSGEQRPAQYRII